MGKRDARLFQSDTHEANWNIVELESHRRLRKQIDELITLATSSTITTEEMQKRLLQGVVMFGKRFATQLVRSLQRDDLQERQSVVWLLTVLDDKETLVSLQHMTQNERLPRSIRLSAALAIAGIGSTKEVAHTDSRRVLLYAIR